jgi:hypothetical protein
VDNLGPLKGFLTIYLFIYVFYLFIYFFFCSGEEEQVLNYQSQQYKVLPALAAAYAFLFGHRRLNEYYQRVHAELMADNSTHLAEVIASKHCIG